MSDSSIEITKIPIEEFTKATLDGDGVFDVLMQANKAHLVEEFSKNRIKGPEYATVYLGSLERTMSIALEFFINGRKAKLEEELVEKQIELMDCEIALCRANIQHVNAQTAQVAAQTEKIPHEIIHLEKQNELITAQIAKMPHEIELAKEQALLAKEQVLIAKENLKKIPHEITHLISQTALVDQQKVLAVLQEDTVRKEQCKLDAEFDHIMAMIEKTASERLLLDQKKYTEMAQTSASNVDPDSVIGKQKLLYSAQTEGIELDAYANMAKEIISTWNVRVTTDPDGHSANAQNKLYDPNVGKVVQAWAQKFGVAL